MGRTRCFDRHDAVEKAMKLFWVRGFEATSLQDLLDELEINNSSFYQSFKSKQAIFDEALELYVEKRGSIRRGILAEPGTVREVLERFFKYQVSASLEENNPGCLVTNTAVSFKRNPHVAEKLSDAYHRLEKAFFELLKREIKQEQLALQSARMLVSVVYGMNVLARFENMRTVLEDIAKQTIESVAE